MIWMCPFIPHLAFLMLRTPPAQSKTSIENALIMHNSSQWQLLIDPQELGNTFLKAYYGGENMARHPIGTAVHQSPLKRGQV